MATSERRSRDVPAKSFEVEMEIEGKTFTCRLRQRDDDTLEIELPEEIVRNPDVPLGTISPLRRGDDGMVYLDFPAGAFTLREDTK